MSEKKKLSEMKSSKWCITYWLTDGRTVETLETLVQQAPNNWALEGQIEQGHTQDDKLHAQLFLKTEQTRGTRIAKFFPDCYINEARNPFALQKYVHKEDTRVDEFKTVENRFPQFKEVRNRFYSWYVSSNPTSYLFKVLDEDKLTQWDIFIGISLEEGMEVDVIGVNPQYRSIIMRYWTNMINIAVRNLPSSIDKKTDRQENLVAPPPS